MIQSRMTCKSTSTGGANFPPRNNCQEQYLFLLEFYINEIESSRLTKLNQMFFLPTTVAFCFLDFKTDDELQLTPVDVMFEPQAGIADDVEPFHSGRSVLFALSREAMNNMFSEFKINFNVVKKMPPDIKPDVLVGKGQIDMTPHFTALRKEILDAAKYPESDLPKPSKSFEDDVLLIFNDRVIGRVQAVARISAYGQTIVTEFECPRDTSSFLFKAEDPECEDHRPLGYKCRVLDPDKCDQSSLFSDNDRRDCAICKPPKLPCSPCGVPDGARIRREQSVKERKKPETETCIVDSCRPIQTSRGPKEPCGKAVVLKVSGLMDPLTDGSKKPEARVTVSGEDEASRPDDLSDPDHDVFVLRIGKKGLVGADEKSDIQLEMRTPKGLEKRPPIRMETREMQTEEPVSGKKAGGKSGKDKKKKK